MSRAYYTESPWRYRFDEDDPWVNAATLADVREDVEAAGRPAEVLRRVGRKADGYEYLPYPAVRPKGHPTPDAQVKLWGPYAGKTGPTHQAQDRMSDLSWCGSRVQFRHRQWTGSASEVNCGKCLRRLELGRPLSFGARA